MSHLDRIKKLVALAGSSNENEARNAAVQACKLIIQHKVVMTIPGEAPAPNVYRNVRTGERPTESVEDVMNRGTPIDFTKVVDDVFGRDAGERFRRAVNTPTPGPPEPMNAPQEGTCRECGEGFAKGDRIWHRRGVGSVHAMKCDPDSLNRKVPGR